jgi:hypothetical protein
MTALDADDFADLVRTVIVKFNQLAHRSPSYSMRFLLVQWFHNCRLIEIGASSIRHEYSSEDFHE